MPGVTPMFEANHEMEVLMEDGSNVVGSHNQVCIK